MKSLKSLFTLTALALSVSGAVLANESALSMLKDTAKETAKSMVSEQVKSTSANSATQQKMLETVTSAKEKAGELKKQVKSLKDSMSTEERASLKEKATEKLASVKDKAKSIASSAKVNINKADAATLQKLSGIGEKKAQAIIVYRDKVGKIKSAADLAKIEGLGSTTIEKIAPYLLFN